MRNTRYVVGATALAACLGAALLAPALWPAPAPAQTVRDDFTLAALIPNDVFMFVSQRNNPAREFQERYWGEVFEALRQSGAGEELIGAFGAVLGVEEEAKVQALKDRALELVDHVDWGSLAEREMAFAETFVPPVPPLGDEPPVLVADMVWLFRGADKDAAGRNYEGLLSILNAVAEEINDGVGNRALRVKEQTLAGTRVASVNLLAMLYRAPHLPLTVAWRDDIVMIALRERLRDDVLDFLSDDGKKTPLSNDERFKAAFAQLPRAEDTMTFFDMQALMKPLSIFADTVMELVRSPDDVYRNSGMSSEITRLNSQAMSAYRRRDVKQALVLVKQAHELDTDNSIVLYNLACFSALQGDKDEALAWLERAVDAGFYAPRKIAADSDLDSLRQEPRYQATLDRAATLVAEHRAADIVINSDRKGEAYRLVMQAWQVHEHKDYRQGLQLAEQAYAVAPQDPRVLYALACFHALMGHQDKSLDFLDQAVNGGFYCPRHISKDTDLKSLRQSPRYTAAYEQARKNAAALSTDQSTAWQSFAQHILDRLKDAVGIMDYGAMVESTIGYSTHRQGITVLVPGASSRAIYPVFADAAPMTAFDRYLPKETASFSVSGGCSLDALYTFLLESFEEAGPQGQALLAKWAEVQEQLNIDVREDLIGWMAGEFTSVTLADGRGSVWLAKVVDEDVARTKVSSAIEFGSAKLPQLMAENPAMAALAMFAPRTSAVQHPDLQGFQNLHFAMSPTPAVWGVADGQLIFGTSADAVALCLATARGEHPNIRHNARLMAEAILPEGPFVAVTLTDYRGLGDELAASLGMASMMSGMMGSFMPDPKARMFIGKVSGVLPKLIPVVRKVDFYKSIATSTTFDGKAWHARSVTHYASPEERSGGQGGVPPAANGTQP